MKFSSPVPPGSRGAKPLAEYLVERFTYYDIDGWNSRIHAGRLTVDGKTASISEMVCAGQTVTYDAGDFDEPPADLSYSIIYEDEWLFAVNKPGNLLIHRAGKSFRNNLMYLLRVVHQPPFSAANCIHRLDRQTSGVVLIAKTPQIQAEISRQFATRQVDKTYCALVHGIPAERDFLINKPIGKDAGNEIWSKFCIDESGKEAITRIESCKPLSPYFSQISIKPLTGRTHQIRVHCASIGHPVVGDRIYGSDMQFADGISSPEPTGDAPLLTGSRHALHCSRIVFFHPWELRECRIEAPLPYDMERMRVVLSGMHQ